MSYKNKFIICIFFILTILFSTTIIAVTCEYKNSCPDSDFVFGINQENNAHIYKTKGTAVSKSFCCEDRIEGYSGCTTISEDLIFCLNQNNNAHASSVCEGEYTTPVCIGSNDAICEDMELSEYEFKFYLNQRYNSHFYKNKPTGGVTISCEIFDDTEYQAKIDCPEGKVFIQSYYGDIDDSTYVLLPDGNCCDENQCEVSGTCVDYDTTQDANTHAICGDSNNWDICGDTIIEDNKLAGELSDGEDYYCDGTKWIYGTPPEICYDQTDNDFDQLIDCADDDCDGEQCGSYSGSKCIDGECKETICDDGIDNDGIFSFVCGDDICDEIESDWCTVDCGGMDQLMIYARNFNDPNRDNQAAIQKMVELLEENNERIEREGIPDPLEPVTGIVIDKMLNKRELVTDPSPTTYNKVIVKNLAGRATEYYGDLDMGGIVNDKVKVGSDLGFSKGEIIKDQTEFASAVHMDLGVADYSKSTSPIYKAESEDIDCKDPDCESKICGHASSCVNNQCLEAVYDAPSSKDKKEVKIKMIKTFKNFLENLNKGVVFTATDESCNSLCNSKGQTCGFAEGGLNICSEISTFCTCY